MTNQEKAYIRKTPEKIRDITDNLYDVHFDLDETFENESERLFNIPAEKTDNASYRNRESVNDKLGDVVYELKQVIDKLYEIAEQVEGIL